jgi:hypothetical protein
MEKTPKPNVDEPAVAQAVETILNVVASVEGGSIDELDLVRRVLEFANTGAPAGLPGARALTVADRTYYMDTSSELAQLRSDLAAIVAGELSGPSAGRLRKEASKQVMVPVFEFDRDGTVRTTYRRFVSELAPLLAYVLLRVRSDEELRGDVKRCRLPGCGRFFLASDQVKDPSAPGRRRHRYCSPAHMNEAQSTGAERTRRWRENVAKRAGKAARKHK